MPHRRRSLPPDIRPHWSDPNLPGPNDFPAKLAHYFASVKMLGWDHFLQHFDSESPDAREHYRNDPLYFAAERKHRRPRR